MTCEQQIVWAAHLPGGFKFRTHERGAARGCVVERQHMHGGEQAHHLAMLALGLAAFRDSGEKLIGSDRRACRKSGHAKTRRRKERRLREGIFAALRLCVTLPGDFFNTLSDTAHSPAAGA